MLSVKNINKAIKKGGGRIMSALNDVVTIVILLYLVGKEIVPHFIKKKLDMKVDAEERKKLSKLEEDKRLFDDFMAHLSSTSNFMKFLDWWWVPLEFDTDQFYTDKKEHVMDYLKKWLKPEYQFHDREIQKGLTLFIEIFSRFYGNLYNCYDCSRVHTGIFHPKAYIQAFAEAKKACGKSEDEEVMEYIKSERNKEIAEVLDAHSNFISIGRDRLH